MLSNRGVFLSAKPFAIGVRIEHPQDFIDEAQYGVYAKHPKLRAADYRVAYSDKTLNRSVYSFCMCPGGEVVAALPKEQISNQRNSQCKRDKENANSALVVW